jgi:hypothetical protein
MGIKWGLLIGVTLLCSVLGAAEEIVSIQGRVAQRQDISKQPKTPSMKTIHVRPRA